MKQSLEETKNSFLEYIYLKSFLNVAGVNVTELDKIKE